MPHLSSAELQQAFQRFIDENPDERLTDFEELDPTDTLRLIPTETEGPYAGQADTFEAIGMVNSASLLAFWQEPGLSSAAERPIVYIDSEGSPTTVFADSFADFLTLLPYGTEFLYKIINQMERARANPHLLGVRFQPITPADAQAALAANRQEYSLHAQYVEWLRTVAGLAVAPDPVGLIEQAFQRHTNLETWLDWENYGH